MHKVNAVYAHFPWCVRKCPYCDFNSHPLRSGDDFTSYTKALLADIRDQDEQLEDVATVFLGGGTPSLFPPHAMADVLSALPQLPTCEITMEANPGSTEHADFRAYYQAGVNRLSIGAQSFDDTQLQKLGRIHHAADTHGAFTQARKGGFHRINLDLMWGLPNQTVEAALTDLQTAIDLGAEHISWYQLTLEPKTEFAKRSPILPVEQTLYDIETAGLALLADAGYTRYEVSAFAKTGEACRHNLNYWRFGDYVGIGAGAHGKITNASSQGLVVHRTQKPTQPRLYQQDPINVQTQAVEPDQLPLEFMMNALRLIDGVSKQTFEQATGLSWQSIEPQWQKLLAQDLVQAERCATTPTGLRYLDSVLAHFLI